MPIETQTFNGTPFGTNLETSAHDLDPRYARYLQDVLVDQPGIVRQRGPIKPATGVVNPVTGATSRALGIIGTYSLSNVFKVAAITGTDSGSMLRFLSDDLSGEAGNCDLPHTFAASGPYPIVDAKAALGGQFLLGMSDKYGTNATKRSLLLWRGATKPDYTTGTITTTAGTSTTVTGVLTTWTINVTPGMFLFSGSGSSLILLGVVKSVTDNTHLELEQVALATVSGSAYKLSPIRGLNPRIATGRITVASGATVVNGGATKFIDQGATNAWALYRASDMRLIGTIGSVASNTQLTLAAGATISMNNERYALIKTTADYAPATLNMGFLHTVWNGFQFYANQNTYQGTVNQTSRVFFAEQVDLEAVDFSKDDGSHFDVPSSKAATTEIVGLIPTSNALVVLKEAEVYGIFGADPDTWQVRRIADDGCLSNHTAWTHEGTALWAGRRGIYQYDGIEARNVTEDTLGDYYADLVKSFNIETSRAWAFVENNHYVLYIQDATPTRGIRKGNTETMPPSLTIVLNLDDMAVSFFFGLVFHGAVPTPSVLDDRGTLYFTEQNNVDSRTTLIGDAKDLFDTSGSLDTVKLWTGESYFNQILGPDIYFEAPKYSMDDPQRKKLFKQVQLHHRATFGRLRLDIIPDLNETATTSASELGPTASTQGASPVWVNKRVKFLKRSPFLSFRIYAERAEDAPAFSETSVTLSADKVAVVPRMFDHNGLITGVAFRTSSGSGQSYRAVIYADNAGTPGSLLATSDTITLGFDDPWWMPFKFNGVAVTANTLYWVGIHAPNSPALQPRGSSPLAGNALGPFKISNADEFDDGAASTWPGTFSSDPNVDWATYFTWAPPEDVAFGPWAIGFKRQRVGRV
jgi:hypothetical protein